jgi:hypothetical protein
MKDTRGIVRIDSYFIRVQELLKDHVWLRPELEERLQCLLHDLADVPASVCLRPYPMDMQIIPGSPDPEGRILGNIQQIKRDTRACETEIRRVRGEIKEIDRLLDCARSLGGKPGQVIRWLYIDRKTWDEVEAEGIVRSEISRYRRMGIEKLANRLHSRIRVDISHPN